MSYSIDNSRVEAGQENPYRHLPPLKGLSPYTFANEQEIDGAWESVLRLTLAIAGKLLLEILQPHTTPFLAPSIPKLSSIRQVLLQDAIQISISSLRVTKSRLAASLF